MPDLYYGGDGEIGWQIITDNGVQPQFRTYHEEDFVREGKMSQQLYEIRLQELPTCVNDTLDPPIRISDEVANILTHYMTSVCDQRADVCKCTNCGVNASEETFGSRSHINKKDCTKEVNGDQDCTCCGPLDHQSAFELIAKVFG